MARKPTDFVQFKLRIREGLRRKIEREAEKKKISANAEAVERIERTFKEEKWEEAQQKAFKEYEKEHAAEMRAYLEQQAREEEELKTALRDSNLLRSLVGGDANARLLRMMVLGLGNNPDWTATPDSRKALADKVHNFLMSVELSKEAE